MQKLTTDDLLSLERYHKERPRMRAEVLAHKRHRQAPIGPNVTLYFEDRVTMRYQVQEMLRAERIFESEAIAEELEAYNPLIPDGTNLKATMMIEYPDIAERRPALERLKGVENRVYLEVGTLGRVFAHADEDLDRSDDTKTSAVHFLRFELDAPMRAALKSGAPLKLGIDHDHYRHERLAAAEVAKSLAADLD
ncbi:MAG TPA: DUF3501 family protein [Gammaproteobacteria bacterium]|nr:DUF3501 family protein [Gammaproteobacteria bacterium]